MESHHVSPAEAGTLISAVLGVISVYSRQAGQMSQRFKILITFTIDHLILLSHLFSTTCYMPGIIEYKPG
ncbi:rCG61271 [Rattus norvegicus]|uniref:RCG61271 n=1 Tax=Rattus norvegicus TaxID=10116 RepID=A6KE70_RAT|nr:rCG61271 [Rattus norvegicus]